MVVLVVGCGSYTGLAGVDGVVAGVDAMKRRLVAEGAEVRTLDGKVTERRLERALRSIGKVARRGQRAGVVLVGHSVAGGFAVENFAMRKAGKRLRIFSAARVAHLMGGVAFGGGVATAKVHVPVVVLPPLGAPPGGAGGFTPGGGLPKPDPLDGWDPTGKKKKFFFDPRWGRRIDRWIGVGPRGQIDAGYEGFRWVVNASGNLENCPWEEGTIALVEISSPNQRGLLEIQEHEDFRREIWRFEGNGSWPHSDFTLKRVLQPSNAWTLADLQAARQWPVAQQLDWKGFQAQAGTPVTLPTAFRLQAPYPASAPPGYSPPTVFARTQTLGLIRAVLGWTATSSQDVGFVNNIIEAKHLSQVTLLFPYNPV